MREAGVSLDIFPERGRKVPEFDRADIREILVGNYRLIYLLAPTTIIIVTILHTSRDLDGLLDSLEF
jgi:toxin ParE1/3/4